MNFHELPSDRDFRQRARGARGPRDASRTRKLSALDVSSSPPRIDVLSNFVIFRAPLSRRFPRIRFHLPKVVALAFARAAV